ncbi:hypothetical protein [Porphyromonas sp. oral taxon 278]|uniref:hypothetical protein n=1 Tax=Porphyromonas sp. oral taxon 278 TaxID=712437 RepID=UPI0025FBD264|nr:hypothetical protein [Porphyromonas sp. oral taxon 278]
MKYKDLSFTKASRFSRPEWVRTEESVMALSDGSLQIMINVDRHGLKRLEKALKTPDDIRGFSHYDLPYPAERYERRKANLEIALAERERRKEEGRWH